MSKMCKECNQELPFEKFTKSKNVKDGYENKCKVCRKEASKRYDITCEMCGTKFKSARKETRLCGPKCIGDSRNTRISIYCDYCGKELEVKRYKYLQQGAHYCDNGCRSEDLKTTMLGENNPNYNRIDYECDGCGKEIKVTPYRFENHKYNFCDYDCYKENIGQFFMGENNPGYKRKIALCDWCGLEFERIPSSIGDNKYCCHECALRDISKKNEIGRKVINCDYCGKSVEVLGSKMKNNTRTYCSVECKNKGWSKFYSGPNNPQWDNSISMEDRIINRNFPGYWEWRIETYKRDNYTCQCCNDNEGGNLNAHHILNYSEHPKLRTCLNNSITLCEECHTSFHKKYGYTKNNEEQLSLFLKKYRSNQASL